MASHPASAPRVSATLVLVRDAADGPEVLLVQRAERGDQNSNAWVFPGGLLDAADAEAHDCCAGLDDAAASARLGLPARGLDIYVAALRETFEEAGLLLALDALGAPLDPPALKQLERWRTQAPGHSLAALCREQGWRLAADTLLPIAHWITPLGLPKRYDTRFLLARAPAGQQVRVDGVEIVAHRWGTPAALLHPGDAAGRLPNPVQTILRELAQHASVDALCAWAATLGVPPTIQPRIARGADGRRAPLNPRHPAYAEVGYLDPHGSGDAAAQITPGRAVTLAPGLIRVTAPNPGMMTGPGTNSYLLCCDGASVQPASRWIVIDPGPDDAAHVQTLLEAIPGRLAAILVTHTHVDHSPAARRLKALTGASLHGRRIDGPPEQRAGQDPAFAPDAMPADGDRLEFGGALVLEALHTPGHASNHLCFLDPARRLLFTGDQVMQGSTVVINPPDGDMSAYLDALERLASHPGYDWIAPGHGFLIGEPQRLVRALIEHRLRREAKVASALASRGRATVAELVAEVYADVPAQRHAVAQRSLLAHLIRLAQRGRARRDGEAWAAV